MRNYRKFIFWEKCRSLAIDIYLLTNSFPIGEKFGLSSQIRRAAVTMGSNIAEGSVKASSKDFLRFLEISLTSATEIDNQLLLCRELGYLGADD